MQNIKLSIIVPVYKVEKYIVKCLESILPQLTDEVELIVVDDCTPDNSAVLAQEVLATSQQNTKMIHKPVNGGLSSARNTGLEVVQGAYCWFVDSDDSIAPGAVRIILDAIQNSFSDLYVFNNQLQDEDGNLVFKSCLSAAQQTLEDDAQRLRFMGDYLRHDKTGFEVWSRIYSMEIIRQQNLRFAPNKEVFAEDVHFNLCYYNYCRNVTVLEDCLYHYLVRDGSIMVSNKRSRMLEMHNLAKSVYQHTPLEVVKENFHLIYAKVLNIHYNSATWEDFLHYPTAVTDSAFAADMCAQIIQNLQQQLRFHGKNNAIRHYVYAQLTKNILKGNSIRAKCWFAFVSILRKL